MTTQLFGKIFQQMYESSVCEDWKAMVTFQQLIVLADKDGIVDMTPEAIHRRTNIPMDIISHGLTELQKEDKRSRSAIQDGRRIVLLDTHRDWGWKIVNYSLYLLKASQDERNEIRRLQMHAQRDIEKTIKNQDSPNPSQFVTDVPHKDIDIDKDKDSKKEEKSAQKRVSLSFDKWPSEPSKDVFADFIRYRNKMKADVNQTVINKMATQITMANKNLGMSVDDCLAMVMEAGWRGFKCDWAANRHSESRTEGRYNGREL